MGLIGGMFNKMGAWHIKQLVKECSKLIINASMNEKLPPNSPNITDATINSLITDGGYSVMSEKSYTSLEEKLADFMVFYVVRNLGRDIDYLSGENSIMCEEIKKYWPVFCETKTGVKQVLQKS